MDDAKIASLRAMGERCRDNYTYLTGHRLVAIAEALTAAQDDAARWRGRAACAWKKNERLGIALADLVARVEALDALVTVRRAGDGTEPADCHFPAAAWQRLVAEAQAAAAPVPAERTADQWRSVAAVLDELPDDAELADNVPLTMALFAVGKIGRERARRIMGLPEAPLDDL